MSKRKFYWLRLKLDFFNQKHIKKLRKMAGGDTYTIIYQRLLLLAAAKEGEIVFSGYEDDIADEIALELDEAVEDVQATLFFIQKFNLAEFTPDNSIFLPEAAENVGKEGDSAARVRAFREKNKPQALHCNTDVTTCNADVTQRRNRKENNIKEKEVDITNVVIYTAQSCSVPVDNSTSVDNSPTGVLRNRLKEHGLTDWQINQLFSPKSKLSFEKIEAGLIYAEIHKDPTVDNEKFVAAIISDIHEGKAPSDIERADYENKRSTA